VKVVNIAVEQYQTLQSVPWVLCLVITRKKVRLEGRLRRDRGRAGKVCKTRETRLAPSVGIVVESNRPGIIDACC